MIVVAANIDKYTAHNILCQRRNIAIRIRRILTKENAARNITVTYFSNLTQTRTRFYK